MQALEHYIAPFFSLGTCNSSLCTPGTVLRQPMLHLAKGSTARKLGSWPIPLTRVYVAFRRRPAATSFVQDLFGLVVQAPCPVDYQDSSSADDSASAAVPAAGAPAPAAGGPASAAANSDPAAAQAPSLRMNGQVRLMRLCAAVMKTTINRLRRNC